ncbi:DUF1648 domain-containing protein ['Paenibacillus yunnanensis' Narsing Rao et al. 2020]|uniref:DUF1648 domain-containing protein n=1 Tax=Paenibacillus tengchongensis TaxID=2608684 RepID=UPI00124D2CEA
MNSLRKFSLFVCSMASLAHFVLLSIFWQRIPARIPVHIGLSGSIDNYGGKHSLLYLAVLGTGVAVLSFMLSNHAPISGGYLSAKNKQLVLHLASMIICLLLLLFSGQIIFRYSL